MPLKAAKVICAQSSLLALAQLTSFQNIAPTLPNLQQVWLEVVRLVLVHLANVVIPCLHNCDSKYSTFVEKPTRGQNGLYEYEDKCSQLKVSSHAFCCRGI